MYKSLLFLLAVIFMEANAQTYQWTPTNSPVASYRYEDVYFLNPDTGFAVHYYSGTDPGYILKTMDAGNTWMKVLDSTQCSFRDVGFTDAMHGWAGTLDPSNTGADTNIIYQSTDGGITWSGVASLPGPANAGICGLQVINDSTLYGVGRYFGPSGFYKTSNNGQTWSYTNLDSLVAGLVDLHFFNPDTGYAIGTTGPQYFNGYGRVLYTTDAGNTWSIAHTSSHVNSLGWKIIFPSRTTGYCSLQFFNFPSTEYFLKTTDGGITWQDVPYAGGPSNGYNVEGMGFLNDTVGWVGGDANVYFTQNGGASWTLQSWGNNLNRFRFLSDSLAYSAGEQIYKLQITPTGIVEPENKISLISNPNPATDFAYFEFYVAKSMRAKLSVYDLNGNEVELVFDKIFNQGNQHFVWQPGNLPQGIYLCRLMLGDQVIKRKLEIIK